MSGTPFVIVQEILANIDLDDEEFITNYTIDQIGEPTSVVGDFVFDLETWPTEADLRKTKEQGGFRTFAFHGDVTHAEGTYKNPNRGRAADLAIIQPIRFVSGQTKTKIVDDILFIDASTNPAVEEWVAVR